MKELQFRFMFSHEKGMLIAYETFKISSSGFIIKSLYNAVGATNVFGRPPHSYFIYITIEIDEKWPGMAIMTQPPAYVVMTFFDILILKQHQNGFVEMTCTVTPSPLFSDNP